MQLILATILEIIAAGAALVVAYALVRILRLVLPAERGRAVRLLVRWQFAAVRHMAGEEVVRPINLFIQAVMLLLGVIVCSVALGAAQLIDAETGAPDEPGLSSLN